MCVGWVGGAGSGDQTPLELNNVQLGNIRITVRSAHHFAMIVVYHVHPYLYPTYECRFNKKIRLGLILASFGIINKLTDT